MIDRNAPRTRTLLGARIEMGAGITLDCTVRDLSETGARLEVSGNVPLPAAMRLSIPKLDRNYEARLRWQRNGFAGVAFGGSEGAASAAGMNPEQKAYVAKLEAELARLRKTIEVIRADPSQARLILERLD